MSTLPRFSDSASVPSADADPLDDPLYGTGEKLRKALKTDLAECRLSRDEVAARLSVRMGRVGAATLDAYIAESKANKFPAELIPAWVEVTKSRRILTLLCGEIGLSVATEEDRDFADLGRAHLKSEKLRKKLEAKV